MAVHTDSAPNPAQLAKGALRRLALARREPTPENYARAYAEEQGLAVATEPAAAADDAADAATALDWGARLDALVQGLDRGGRHWTLARRKQALRRLLARRGTDPLLLARRLDQLLENWSDDRPDDEGCAHTEAKAAEPASMAPAAPSDAVAYRSAEPSWPIIDSLQLTIGSALPDTEPEAAAVAETLARLAQRIAAEGASEQIGAAVDVACDEARRILGRRHLLVDELLGLCRSLNDGLVDLAEDARWVQGQTEGLRQRLGVAPGVRAVRAARELFDEARLRQRQLRTQREEAREALKSTISRVLSELGELDTTAGRFGDRLSAGAAAIASADSLEGLAHVVRDLLGDSKELHALITSARSRLVAEHARAGKLQARVQALEQELQRLADEATTDTLTQIANRRGLMQVFADQAQRLACAGAEAPALAVGLLDIDNFKKLNDALGHAAGDEALRSLAARVRQWLRPNDHVARFGGEEFVVLLPAMAVDEAQQALTQLQRQMSASLFMHDGREVFVTFSAGVTAYRPGETIESALERADEGLYEAKRSGKNRTCVA